MAEDVRFFFIAFFFFGALLSGGAGGNGSRARLDLPSSFFFHFFFHVRRSAGGIGSRTRLDLPSFFFPFFFHVRRSAGGRIRPELPSFFPFFFHVRRSGTAPAARPGGRSLRRLLVELVGHHMHFVARTRGEAPEGHLRRSGGRRSSTPGRRDSVLSLACTLLAAGRRAQGAGGEGEVFAERVDEVCLHLTAGRFDQEAGGGAEGGEGGEGAVAGLSTLLFLLCHGRMPLRSNSTRRHFLFCQVQENTRFCTELAAERRWTASHQERVGADCFFHA